MVDTKLRTMMTMLNDGDAVEKIWESGPLHLNRVIDVCATQYGFVDRYFTAVHEVELIVMFFILCNDILHCMI